MPPRSPDSPRPPASQRGDRGPRDPLAPFGRAAREWFDTGFPAPTPVQARGWERIAAGAHALLLAPTGSGKTLAAFFACIDRLGRLPDDAPPGVRVLYVSPLKALVYDIERNLRAPLVGVERVAALRGERFRTPRVAIRTGDTSQKERRDQSRNPAEILVTTPESLYLILGSQQRETLETVETIIVDEIHALAPTKRGAHLALSLERVAAACRGGDPQRIGLSATARPIDEIARFLGGDRAVDVVDTTSPPRLDLTISVPVPDMTQPDAYAPASPAGPAPGPGAPPASPGGDASAGLWPAIYPELLAAIRAHRSTIVFVNSRGLCERLARRLNELAGEELVLSHHGSLAHERRRDIEEALKAGRLRAIVATSSLELGIDMGAVDLVLLVESPGAVARGLQRVGRAGHQVDEVSIGRVFPKHRGDLLEATVVARGMREGAVEPIRGPRNPLDVLAQQIVAMCSVGPWPVAELERRIRRAAPFRDLSHDALCGVLDMLAGRYPSTDFAELRPRLLWDRERDHLEARRGAGKLALLSGGTIPDRGLYAVHLGPDGPRVGELDEEMVHESRAGEIVTLGASSWRVVEITRDRVIVQPAPGEVGRLPFWRGEGPGRPIELGRALGAFTRELAERCRGAGGLHDGRGDAEAWLRADWDLDEWAARNLVDYVVEQHEATGALPTDRAITIERFRDELGDWRVCILSPFGARLHAPWALAIEARLSQQQGWDVQTLWSDDGIVLRFADAETLPEREVFLPEPEELEDLVVEQLAGSALFAAQFRENAARALLLPRRRPGARTPLWTQRLRAQNLLAVARQFPAFPIMLETYRACLQDVFDVPALVETLRAVRERRVRVDEVETRQASPFARSLVFAYTAAYLYQGDMPVAERRAQALTLDRHMLRDLLGQEELRDLLDAAVIDQTTAELQCLDPEYRARHADAVHDLLLRLGDLDRDEVLARCDAETPDRPAQWLAELEASRRALPVKVAGHERWIAAEDAAVYRDALGVALPGGLPDAFLEPAGDPMEQLVGRFARRRGPFVTRELADRYGLVAGQVEAVLSGLEVRGRLLSGEFHPNGMQREWCDPEVLRRLRRRTLARLRGEVAPVENATLARFLPCWHGIAAARAGGAGSERHPEARLEEVLEQLEGLPLPFSELEAAILPARIPGYDPRLLDERGALGELVWVGCGSLGERDGRVCLYRRERAGLLAEPPVAPEDAGRIQRVLLDHLGSRGACFFAELLAAAEAHAPGSSQKDVLAALYDLVWGGLVTNDTLAPLRALAARRRRPAGAGTSRGRRPRSEASPAAGRWSLVQSLLADEVPPTRRAHARARMLLERWGVVSRDAMGLESIPGGFAGVYPVLRAMEESGKLRRGHFVDGLLGAQFAFAGAVDRLRAARVEEEPEAVLLLSACDPANPYGALLPWPAARSETGRPRRAAGCSVVLAGGEPVLFVERGGGRLLTFDPEASARPEQAEARRVRAAGALRGLFRDRGRGAVRVEQIDDQDATGSWLAPTLLQAGFRRDYKGLVLDRFPAPASGR